MLAVTRSSMLRLAAVATVALAIYFGHGAIAARHAAPPRRISTPHPVSSVQREAAHVVPAVASPGHCGRAPVNSCVWTPSGVASGEYRIAPCLPATNHEEQSEKGRNE